MLVHGLVAEPVGALDGVVHASHSPQSPPFCLGMRILDDGAAATMARPRRSAGFAEHCASIHIFMMTSAVSSMASLLMELRPTLLTMLESRLHPQFHDDLGSVLHDFLVEGAAFSLADHVVHSSSHEAAALQQSHGSEGLRRRRPDGSAALPWPAAGGSGTASRAAAAS